ncbi:hypothetical protein MAE02_13100 [Microvirga aerophila]|uniref:Uncharacterized protein n=1 Tax=Microvirga aerophila TaxID=670291 RepID=A0A512BNV1_9HYPH|nr:hypothetical protein MAE02_13100 [Microvirga aerophila]
MQPNSEHEQNDADLGKLVGEALVGHIAGREGAHQNACEQVADEGGDAESMRQGAKSECQYEADNDG